MRSTAVMFNGVDGMIKAYQANDVAPWSLWNGPKQLLFSYNGDDMMEGEKMLREACQLLKESGCAAALTLCVYEGLPKGQKIKSNTAYDNSFSFSLWSERDGERTPYMERHSRVDDRLKVIEDLLVKMNEPKDEEEEPEKISGTQGMLAGYLEHPDVRDAIAGKFVDLIKSIPNIGKARQIAGIPGQEGEPTAPSDVQQQQQQISTDFNMAWGKLNAVEQTKMLQAITMLLDSDKELPDHLMSLAKISKNDKTKYSLALKFL